MTKGPTDSQGRAIRAGPGATLVVAGPGAGKTYCLIGRIGFLLSDRGLRPERICAVTFTNKAAGEISARLEAEGIPGATGVLRGTLHALCLAILRPHAQRVGLQPGFGVADEAYQLTLLGQLGARDRARQRALLSHFGRFRLRNQPLSPEDDEIFEEYRRKLRAQNLVDFDDIILLTASLLAQDPGLRLEIAGRWDALLVDEFQDLGLSQYAIVRHLVEPHGQVFVVGDDEQSIFSWTGADPRVLQRFQKDFGVEPVILEENRRCSKQIFDAARRVLQANPMLFAKKLVAVRESPFPVRVLEFADDAAEADWLVADLADDQRASRLSWGRYALLYRKHTIGTLLERRLLDAGIPVRTAQGRALTDDPVIAEVLDALRIALAPGDPVPVESLARRVLPPHVVNHAQAEFGRDRDMRTALSLYVRLRRGEAAERKRIRRFLFHVENLPALAQAHESLPEFVDALLAARPRTRPSYLERHVAELSDPREYPGARELLADLDRTLVAGGTVRFPTRGGLDIALDGMLAAAGLSALGAGGSRMAVMRPQDLAVPDQADLPVRLFKALQLRFGHEGVSRFDDCVTFDLETTGRRAQECEIVEIGAARVRRGEIVETYRSMVKPERPIPDDVRAVHGYSDADVAEAPSFDEVWPTFRAFVGDDILVAHNALGFDLPVLRRAVTAVGGTTEDLAVFDTLPLARSVLSESARLGDLARRFDVPFVETHHALDDAVALVGVMRGLERERLGRQRRTAFTYGLDWLGLALAIAGPVEGDREGNLLFEIARFATLGRYGDSLERFARESAGRADAPTAAVLIERLGGERLRRRLRHTRPPAQRYPISVARLQGLMETIEEADLPAAMRQLLDKSALSRSEGVEADDHRVNLLTLHATKGLEFSRVYVVGVEDAELPGLREFDQRLEDTIAEARRLLYVGMTRAEDRLILTRALLRGGRPTGGRLFLDELGLPAEGADQSLSARG